MPSRPDPDIRERERAELESKHVVTRCAFCKWSFRGLFKDGRAAHAAHRERKHPEIQPPLRRKNRNLRSNRQAALPTWEREAIETERRKRARLSSSRRPALQKSAPSSPPSLTPCCAWAIRFHIC